MPKETMSGVWIVVLPLFLLSDEIHDFVFSLSWHVGTREDNGEMGPSRIRVKFLFDEVLQVCRAAFEEGRAGCDDI